jgi:colanic acid biosynthesis glycosyl transferase WcaI
MSTHREALQGYALKTAQEPPQKSLPPMRILVWSIAYAPDLISVGKYSGEMCSWLSARGHEVKVITAPPYYPAWEVPESYKTARYVTEQIDGIEVTRCPMYVPKIPTGMKRLLHLMSFAASSSLAALRLALRFRPDILLVVVPSFMITPGALAASQFSGAASWLHVQDFEIDAAFELGLLRGERARRFALWIERRLLRRFSRVSSISRKMMEGLDRKGVPAERAVEFRNWVDTSVIVPGDRQTSYRQSLQIAPEAIVALYSGNMANKQGLEYLAAAARHLAGRRSDIVFVLSGNGPLAGRLRSDTEGLPNVRFLDLQPLEKFSELLATADIHLLPQRAAAADLVLPSKLAGMLSSGRPIIAMAEPDTQLATEIEDVGIAIEPGNGEVLAAAIETLANDADLRARLGGAGRAKALARWGMNAILTEFEQKLSTLVVERR